MRHLKLILLALTATVFTSCDLPTGFASLQSYQAYQRPASKPKNPSAVKVKISTSKQMIYVMENGKPLLAAPCTVGAGTSTPMGNFTIYKKNQYKRANSHGWAYKGNQAIKCSIGKTPPRWKFIGTPMPYWCEFKENYGIHTGWVKHYPSSHGCIRLHENVSPKFFALVKVGTPVNISRAQPEDATIGINVPLAPNADPLPDYPPSMYTGNGYFSRHTTPTYQ